MHVSPSSPEKSPLENLLRAALVAGLAVLIVGTAAPDATQAQDRRIIDMHLHALPLDMLPAQWDTLAGYERPPTADALRRQTLDQLNRLGVSKAVISGHSELVAEYRQAAPERIITGLWIPWDIQGDSLRTYLDSIPRWHEQENFEVLGEVLTQYSGIAPDDPILDPLWAFAEQEGVPVGIHLGPSCPDSFSDGCTPLALKEVLAEHPDLKVYVMHGGYPKLKDMIDLLSGYPQVYVGAVFNPFDLEEQRRYLKGLVEAGYANRIMFGSDQMVWPELIGDLVEVVKNADYLSEDEKEAIFYENAAQFLEF